MCVLYTQLLYIVPPPIVRSRNIHASICNMPVHVHVACMYLYIHVLMRDEKEERKKQARSNKQTRQSNTARTPKAVTFPKKNELPRVELEPTTLYTLDRALYH